jgi:hypothetical protein
VSRRRQRFRKLPAGIALLLLGAVLPAAAVSGYVHDEHGKPKAGARACYLVPSGEALCDDTDEHGYYTLPPSPLQIISIRAAGYLPARVDAVVLEKPVRLSPAASIRITLLDADSGKPIADGRIMIVRPTGKQLGPLPTQSAGMVRFLTLEPGTVMLTAEAPGYETTVSENVELVAHDEADVLVRMKPSAPKG